MRKKLASAGTLRSEEGDKGNTRRDIGNKGEGGARAPAQSLTPDTTLFDTNMVNLQTLLGKKP